MLIRPRSKKRKAIQELLKREQSKLYQTDPVAWQMERFSEPITNWYWSQFPGYENHIWDGTPDPFATAINALANGEWVGIESATSTGKTYVLPRIIYWFLDAFPNSLVVTTAPKKDQLKKILWMEVATAFPKFQRIRTFSEMLQLNLTVDSRRKVGSRNRNKKSDDFTDGGAGHEAIGFVSQVGAGEESATKMQGFHRENMLFVLEECAGLPMAVIKAVENTSTAKNNMIIAVGNPDSQLDALHLFCEKKRTKHITISAYDHPNVVLNKAIIPGAVTIESINFRKEEYGEESPFFKSRIRGIAPTEDTDALIRGEYMDKCNIHNKQKFIDIPFRVDKDAANALGADIANSIDGDKACLAWGRGNELQELHEFHCPDANYLAYNIMLPNQKVREMGEGKHFAHNVVYNTSKLVDYDVKDWNVGVDAVGVGVGTINTLRNNRVRCIGLQGGQKKEVLPMDKIANKPLYEFNSLRAQMYFTAMLDLKRGDIRMSLPENVFRALKRELTVIKYKTMGGKIGIESKDEIKKKLGGKSPNMADAFVYWNWIRKNYYKPSGALPFS